MEYDRSVLENTLEQGSRVCLEYELEENISVEYHFVLNKKSPSKTHSSKDDSPPTYEFFAEPPSKIVECIYYKSTINDPLKLFGTKYTIDEFMSVLSGNYLGGVYTPPRYTSNKVRSDDSNIVMEDYMGTSVHKSNKLIEIRVCDRELANYFENNKNTSKILPKAKILSNEQDVKKENFSINQRETDKLAIEKLLQSFKSS